MRCKAHGAQKLDFDDLSKLYAKITVMKKILLVKTSSLGDVIHNLPVVNDILQHYPNAQIDWVVEENFADIPRLHPKVNQVFTVAMRRWRKAIFNKKTWAEIKISKQSLSLETYDCVIDTQGLMKSAMISRQAKGVKHGYDKHSIREPFASHFYDVKHHISYQQHAVIRNRTLVAMSLGYSVPTDAPDYGIALPNEKIHAFDLPNIILPANFFVALHGTSKESKLWPEDYWVNLGQQLTSQNLVMIMPWASDAELARAKRIAAQVPAAIVLPKCSIANLARIIATSKIAIGVDTGLSHLATALDIPTIALYTDTDPQLTGVMAGKKTQAINLGGKQNIPTVQDVMNNLILG
jgi:heptosyltransferase-1